MSSFLRKKDSLKNIVLIGKFVEAATRFFHYLSSQIVIFILFSIGNIFIECHDVKGIRVWKSIND